MSLPFRAGVLWLVGHTARGELHPESFGKHPYQVGRAYDLGKLNLWDYTTGMTAHPVLAIGDQLYFCGRTDKDCIHTSATTVTRFGSLRDFAGIFRVTDSMTGEVDIHSVTPGISASTGMSMESGWFHDIIGSVGFVANIQRCHYVEDSCLAKGGWIGLHQDFTKAVNDAVEAVGVDPFGEDPGKLDMWIKFVILGHGTHLCTGTGNGALMEFLTYIDASGASQKDCVDSETCLSLEALGLNVSACRDVKACTVGKQFQGMWSHTCSAVGGGDGWIATQLCDPTLSIEDRRKFFHSGDLDDSKSVVNMHFMRLDSLLLKKDFDNQAALTLGKAIDFHLCKADDDAWQWRVNNGKGKCECLRKCQNGGILDEASCTCQCPSNDIHGFRGAECKEDFGHCIPGPRTGNPDAAQRCITHNYCSSGNPEGTAAYCKNTDVCCLTDFKGTCCPFGSECQCGMTNCKCKPLGGPLNGTAASAVV